MRLSKQGIDVVALITQPFVRAARTQAEIMGVPDLPIAVLPHPGPGARDETRAEHACAIVEEVMSALDAQARVPVARRRGAP